MLTRPLQIVMFLALLVCTTLSNSCMSLRLGHRFAIDPRGELKIGHDQKTDVLRKMGQPYRRFVDTQGHEVFTYVWADGYGNGQKAVIAFNENNVIYLIEVSP